MLVLWPRRTTDRFKIRDFISGSVWLLPSYHLYKKRINRQRSEMTRRFRGNVGPCTLSGRTLHRKIKRDNKIARFGPLLWHRPKRSEPWSLLMMLIRKGRKVSRIIGCILLTLTVFAVTGFALLVSLGSGVVTKRKPQPYERCLASQAGFLNDPKAYHAAMFERARQGNSRPRPAQQCEYRLAPVMARLQLVLRLSNAD